jgi:hypothetical protein
MISFLGSNTFACRLFHKLKSLNHVPPIASYKSAIPSQASVSPHATRRLHASAAPKHRLDHTIIPIELDPAASVAPISESNF